MALKEYRQKRHFAKTPEPKGDKVARKTKNPIYVIQKHHARNLHYDLRLEMRGVLKSWAVPKGPPKKIGEKRLAILTENHPLAYANFSGVIPKGEYGGGLVKIWDKGTYERLKTEDRNVIKFKPIGGKLKGAYVLLPFKDKSWLLMKVKI